MELPRKIARGISLRETTLCGCPLRSHDFVTPHRCFSLPRFRSAQSQPHGPSQHPGACRRSAPFRCAKPRWPVVAPAGGNVLATPFSLRSNVAPRSHPGLASIPSAYVLFFGAFFGAKMPPPGHAFAFLPAGASFRFVSPRGRGVRHPYGSSSAAAFMVAAPVTYTLPAFLNAPDSSTTALVLPFATFTTRSATP